MEGYEMTAREIANRLYTIGIKVSKDYTGYTETHYDVVISNNGYFARLFYTNSTKELKEWYKKEGFDLEYESVIKIHGIRARKEIPYWC
jgi:hypothetical protein